jgi:acetyl-CoA C-acetyltransferase
LDGAGARGVTACTFGALRTPPGKARPDGGLANMPPHELIQQLANGIERRTGGTDQATALILEQVGAQGGNIALISKLNAGPPDDAAAWTLNNYCVSSLAAIGRSAGMVATGASGVGAALGVERLRSGGGRR